MVAAARNEEALTSLVAEIERIRRTRQKPSSPMSGTMPPFSRALQVRAIERFGRIESWIDDAGVRVVCARDLPGSALSLERAVQVNLLGVIYRSKVAA